MTLRQPARSLFAALDSKRGRALDIKLVHATGFSLYGYLYGKDLGREGPARPPIIVTTIGRHSGNLHRVALTFFAVEDGYAVVGSAGGSETEPHWVRNARANSAAWVRVRRRTVPVQATVLDGTARQPIWDEIMAQAPVYGVFQDGISRIIPVVVLRSRETDGRSAGAAHRPTP